MTLSPTAVTLWSGFTWATWTRVKPPCWVETRCWDGPKADPEDGRPEGGESFLPEQKPRPAAERGRLGPGGGPAAGLGCGWDQALRDAEGMLGP